MNRRSVGYMKDVDRVVSETPLEVVLQHYGHPLPKSSSGEHRMQCVFQDSCSDSTYGNLAVNQETAAKVIFCHSCGVRGNLLTLIHGLENGRHPSDGKLRGNEFKDAAAKLMEIAGSTASPTASKAAGAAVVENESSKPHKRNSPLANHDKTRGIADLYEDFVSDVSRMPPKTAAYFRERQEWLTAELCERWGVGYLPRDGRSMFRGWIVYTHRNEGGEVVSYSGRDVNFDEKWQKWVRDGRPDGKKPQKHKYVKGYHRGLELYGQTASRLDDAELRYSLKERGLVVVEGANEVIRLDSLGVAAVGLCSNRATPEQVTKLVRFAAKAAAGRVVLMPDNDEEGELGFQPLAWKLMKHNVGVRLAWSRTSHDGEYDGLQPEQITTEQWQKIADVLSNTSR